jgi:hypothetical protein
VLIDGKEVGTTPATVRGLSRGGHLVRITRDGYIAEERRIFLTERQPAQSLTVGLDRPRPAGARTAPSPATSIIFTGDLSIESRPSGAAVYLDGKMVGTTPLQIRQADAGEHVVRLELDGYRRWSSSVRVVSGEQNRVTASLER